MATPTKVKKWGSSMAVVIPAQFAKSHNIDVGSVLDLETVKVLAPAKRTRYKLEDLMKDFKPEHRQEEWDLGEPKGKEVW